MLISLIFMLLSCALALAGGGLLGIWYFMGKPRDESLREMDGIVTEIISKHDVYRPEQVLFYPVVEFTPPQGEVIRFESKYGTRPPSQRVGDAVRVYYNPSDPRQAEIQPPALRMTGLAVARIVGIAALALGCLCMLASALLAFTGI